MKAKPGFTAKRVVELAERDQGLQHSIVRMYSRRIDRTRKDPARFSRRQPVLILNRDTGAETLRFVMGAGQGGVKKDEVALDYDAIDALGIRFSEDVSLDVKPASMIDVLRHYMSHPDMGTQVSMRLALLGVYLGSFGVICGVISVVAAFW